MKRTTNHTIFWLQAFLWFSLLLVSPIVHAQDVTTSPVVPRDTIIAMDAEAEEEESDFHSVVDEDLQPVARRRMDTGKVAQLKNADDFWYVNEVPPQKQKLRLPSSNPSESLQNKTWLRNLLWVLVVGGFVAVLLWFLVASDIQLFRRPAPVIEREEEDEELSAENIFDIDYEQALKRAMAAHNYRLAIRLLYLQTLKDLAMRNLIQYKQERTNNDYLMQLFHTTFYKDFFRLTRNFEYAWYGQFPVSRVSFDVIRDEFVSFKQRISW